MRRWSGASHWIRFRYRTQWSTGEAWAPKRLTILAAGKPVKPQSPSSLLISWPGTTRRKILTEHIGHGPSPTPPQIQSHAPEGYVCPFCGLVNGDVADPNNRCALSD